MQTFVTAGPVLVLFTGDLQPHACRKGFNGRNKIQPVVFHDEAQDGAVRAATETVIELLALADRE